MSGIRGERYIDENGNEVLTGGLKAAAKNLKRDPDFYKKIGSKGGKNGHTGGFAYNPGLAIVAGAKGGRKSKRGPALRDKQGRAITKDGVLYAKKPRKKIDKSNDLSKKSAIIDEPPVETGFLYKLFRRKK